MLIVTYNGKPIAATNDTILDPWKVFKALVNELTQEGVKYWIENPITDKDFEEWRSRNIFRGESWKVLADAYNVKTWVWSDLNGFVAR